MPPVLVHKFSPTSSTPERWISVHIRRLHNHTLHHNALSVNDDGRIAFASGQSLNILHPPSHPPLKPSLCPALRCILPASIDSSTRKDALTFNFTSTLIWVHPAILFLNGASSLTLLRLPAVPDNDLRFSLDVSLRWDVTTLSLLPHPSQGLPGDLSSCINKFRTISVTRVAHPHKSEDPTSSLLFTSFLVCATETATDLYPIDAHASESTFSTPISSAIRLHHRRTVTIACADSVSTEQGLCTLVALSDDARKLVIYSITMDSDSPLSIQARQLWISDESLPPVPILSLSWSQHSARNSFITLAASFGNDVMISDWGYASDSALNSHICNNPRIQYISDAHHHIVTGVQICHDGSVVSAGMDGRIVCWRVNANLTPDESGDAIHPAPIIATVLQDRSEVNETVMALKGTSNAFAVILVAATARVGHEVSDPDFSRKYNGSARRTTVQLLVVPPYGSAEDIEQSIISCTNRLMSHPSKLDRPLTLWDASHFIHFFERCAAEVVPRLCIWLTDMVEKLESGEASSTQQFVQRSRALLWLCRVINHPQGSRSDIRTTVEDASRRLLNSLLYVRYAVSLHQFSKVRDCIKSSCGERMALENMCQFISVWRAKGWAGREAAVQTVGEVQQWLAPYVQEGERLSTNCPICACLGLETPVVLVSMDPSTLCCPHQHSFQRCVLSGLPMTDTIALECCGCGATAVPFDRRNFDWMCSKGECPLCKGGMVDSQCEVDEFCVQHDS